MKIQKIVIAMSYIDDDLVSGAVEYKANHCKKNIHFLKYIAIVATCLALIAGADFLFKNKTPPTNEVPPVSEAPAHFYYDGNLYLFSGETVYSLPKNFKLVSEVNNVGNSYTNVDFDGNVDGYIFMSEFDKSIAYFQWKEWNESVDGKEPYLVLVLKKQ